MMRGGAARKLVGLITQRSQVQILSPLLKACGEGFGYLVSETLQTTPDPTYSQARHFGTSGAVEGYLGF